MDENSLEQTQLLRNIWNEMKQLGANLGARIDQTNSQLGETNARLDQTNARLESVENRLGSVEGRLETIDGHLEIMDGRLASMDGRLNRVEGSLRDLADQQLILTRVVKNVADRHDESLDDLRERVTRLETKLSDDE